MTEECGHVMSTGSMRWRCIKPPHDDEEDPPTRPDKMPPAAAEDRHYYVRIQEPPEDS